MKKGRILVKTLYWFCNISFYLLILFFVTALAFQMFTKEGKVGQLSVGNHHSIGYPIPVKFQITPKKPMYNNRLFKLENESVNVLDQSYSSGTSEFVTPINSKDSLDYKSIISVSNSYMVDYYEVTSRIFVSHGYVLVKPNTLLNKIVIIIRNYLSYCLLIAVFFFLKKTFKELKSKFEFSEKIYKSIKIIGVLLIFKVLLVSILNFILGKTLPYISIEPFGYGLNYANISINPRLDFDFILFFMGFTLIVLSALLKKGKHIQQENDLTI